MVSESITICNGVYLRELGKDKEDPHHFFRVVKEHLLNPKGKVIALYMEGAARGNAGKLYMLIEEKGKTHSLCKEEALEAVRVFSRINNNKSAAILFGKYSEDFKNISSINMVKSRFAIMKHCIDVRKIRIKPIRARTKHTIPARKVVSAPV